MSDNQLRVLSLNCWGLKFVSKNRDERIEAIAHELSQGDHDIIALQEIWVYSDYQKVQERLAKRLPNSKFFYGGALGAGLAIFTRFPILSTAVHPYSLNGAPIDVTAGDWFVGKAAAALVLLHPILGQVQIFNTHLFAKGGEDGPEHLRAHRLQIIPTIPGQQARAGSQAGGNALTMSYTANLPGTTPPPSDSVAVLRATQCKVVFTDHVPGHTFSYSDHFGLEATLAIETSPANAPAVLDVQRELTSAAMATTIQAWTACYRFAKERMKKELIIFAVSIFALVAVAIGTAWLPYAWITPIFILFSIAVSWLATTMLYHGFLFGNWECNALMNAIEDLEHHRKGLQILGRRNSGNFN
ncbi:hypothetical protein EST38_g3175 [Candolleomyces aberdarensis]|uniref:Endonuclease/exonuclease/phosphatase domain-containing protein n=1 Tax=Candolleomyces aberdarensis TaxID=2316362 RepID=A0A4Q2DRL3_9AGAR|nr:hypothetical protein EST38_g3175 [Candolleomyces aberdarensis]